MKSNFSEKGLLLTLLSSGAFFSDLEAQTATVYPQEHPQAVTNPGMGNRVGANGGAGDINNKVYMTKSAKMYLPWVFSEKSRTEDLSDLISATENSFVYAPVNNYKMTPRIFVHQFQPVEDIADYLKPWDYNSERTRDDVLRIIRKIGKVWDKDPRIDAVETGIIGFYGEQQTYSVNGIVGNVNDARVGPDQVRWAKIMADAFKEAFPNKPLSVREMKTYSRYGNELKFGTFWDLFASPRQYATGTFQELQDFGDRPNFMVNNNRPPKHYLETPIYGEMDWTRYYNDPARANDPNRDPDLMIGTSPGELFVGPDSATYSTRYANYVRKTHATAINGMYSNSISPSPTDVNQQKVLKALGYRFHITEFSTLRRVEPGATITVSAKVKNLGSAPIYQNYPVYFFLLKNKNDLTPAFKVKIEDIDIRKWHPGSDFNWEPKSNPTENPVYNVPPVDNLMNASITIPSSLTNGDYFAGIAIEEPSTNKPGIYFAIPNFFAASQTQPLCQIGVGQDPTNFEMSGVAFDNIHVNDNRSYSLNYYKTLPEVKLEVIRTGTTTGPSTETSEPSGNVKFKFTRQASDPGNPLKTDIPLKVTFEVAGSATNGVDYQSLPNSVIIPIGSTSATMDLNVINDTTMEREGETVVLNLTSNQINYYLTSAKQATVTINDDVDFDMATLGSVELLGSWVQGKSNPVKPGTNRALIVLPTAVHLKGVTDTATPLRVSSVSYGGIPMSMVTENSYKQGTSGHYAYSGAFVLGEAGIAMATSDVILATWQTPDGAVEPKSGSNIASAFFSKVKQLVPSGLPSTTNPLKNSAASNDTSGRLTFNTSATPEVDEFKNEAGDYIITAGVIYPKVGVYRVDSGFTGFAKLLPDFTHEFASSGDFYGFKVGSGVAEKPTFGFSYNDRKSMVGFVLKKLGYNFDGWTEIYGLTAANAKPADDFDNDGMPNLMEYALGLNPSVGNSNPLTSETVEISGKRYLSQSVNRDPNALATVTIRGATTGELTGGLWSSASTVEIENSPTRYVVRDTVAIGDASKRFIRLEYLPK